MIGKKKYKAIVVGVSAGGMEALKAVLTPLRKNLGVPIVIVQHTGPDSDDFLACYLNKLCNIEVKEAGDKENIKSGVAYIAPANYHVLIEDDHSIALSVEPKVNYARPSVDVLFESAADVYAESLIGIVLTGANNDGAAGLKKIKDFGGLTLVQCPDEAEASSMPSAALEAVDVDYVLKLKDIGPFINKVNNCGKI